MNMLLRLCVLCVLEARAGDDEGAVEVVIGKATGETVLAANLLISGKWYVSALGALFLIKDILDTSEYPRSHSLFCYSPDGDLSAKLQRIVDDLAEASPKPLGHTITDVVGSVARALGTASKGKASIAAVRPEIDTEVEDDDDDEEEDYGFEDYDDIGTAIVKPDSVMAILQQ